MALNTTIEDNVLNASKPQTNQGTPGTPAPASPLGASGQGQTAEQAKMAGTPAQKAGAAIEAEEQDKLAQQGQQAAVDATKDKDPYKSKGYLEKTAEPVPVDEAAKKNASKFTEDMQGLGSFANKVENIVLSSMAGEETGDIETDAFDALKAKDFIQSNSATWAKFKKDDTVTDAQMTTAFDAITAAIDIEDDTERKTTMTQAVTAAGNLMGSGNLDDFYTNLAEGFNLEADDFKEAIASGVAEGVIDYDDMTLDNLTTLNLIDFEEDFGWSEEMITQYLGSNWKALKPGDIAEKLEQASQAEFSEVQGLRKQLQDPNLDPAQRKALQRRLQQLAASGVMGSEQQVKAEIKRQEAADVFQFGDKEWTYEEFLDDDVIEDYVGEYLALKPKDREKWKDTHPELGTFIDAAVEASEESKEALLTRLDEARAGWQERKDLKKMGEGVGEYTNAQAEEYGMNMELGTTHGLSDGSLFHVSQTFDSPDEAKTFFDNFNTLDSKMTPAQKLKYGTNGQVFKNAAVNDKATKDIAMAVDWAATLDDIQKDGAKDIDDALMSFGLWDDSGGDSLAKQILAIETDIQAWGLDVPANLKREYDFLKSLQGKGKDEQFGMLSGFLTNYAGDLETIIDTGKSSERQNSSDDYASFDEQPPGGSKIAQSMVDVASEDGVFDDSDITTIAGNGNNGPEILNSLSALGATANLGDGAYAAKARAKAGELANAFPKTFYTDDPYGDPGHAINRGQNNDLDGPTRNSIQDSFTKIHTQWGAIPSNPFRGEFLGGVKEMLKAYALGDVDKHYIEQLGHNDGALRGVMEAMATHGNNWREEYDRRFGPKKITSSEDGPQAGQLQIDMNDQTPEQEAELQETQGRDHTTQNSIDETPSLATNLGIDSSEKPENLKK